MKRKGVLLSSVVCSIFFAVAVAENVRSDTQAADANAVLGTTGGPAPSTRFLALASATNQVGSTSTSLSDLPDMEVGVNSTGDCISATFSAEVAAGSGSTPETIGLRALLDGTVMEGHAGGVNNTHTPKSPFAYWGLVSFTSWKCGVSRGSHVVSIQWTSYGGTTIWARGRTLVVQGR